MATEKEIWRGNSSQVVNFSTFVVCGLLCWLIVPIFYACWKWWENKCRVYVVTTERIKMSQGVITKRTEELELYRVKDTTVVEPFLSRLFNAGDIHLTTSDVSNPLLTLEAIKNVHTVREELRRSVESYRQSRGVHIREME
jgi:uncharacterized membrane protein YdbT with pleckstrin-like domain